MKTAIIAGATGLTGSLLVSRLLKSPSFEKVIIISRRPVDPSSIKAEIIIWDFISPISFPPVDAAFCCIGTTIKKAGSREAFLEADLYSVIRFAGLAKAAGASSFTVISSVGADEESKNFYLQVKGKAEKELGKLKYEALHIFQPSLLLGNRKESRPGEQFGKIMGRLLSFLLLGPLRKYKPVKAEAVAGAMLSVAVRGGYGVKRYHYNEILTNS